MATASPPSHPSDLFAGLAAAMVSFVPDDENAWRAALDAIDPGLGAPEDRRTNSEELCSDVLLALNGLWPPPPPTTAATFANYAVQLQRIDRWHTPLLPTSTEDRSVAHESALDEYYASGHFNSDTTFGSVIPRASPDAPLLRADEELDWANHPSTFAVVSALLEICTYLPRSVRGDDPDDAGLRGTRDIRISLQRYPAGMGPARQLKSDLHVAVAPVLERGRDARFWRRGNKYSVHPRVSGKRLGSIVTTAIELGADLLLLPEMSVDASLLSRLSVIIRSARADYLARTGSVPRLSFVMCGVIRRRRWWRGHHRNYIAVLNAEGAVLLEQDKLSHWNLDEATQRRFNIPRGAPVPLLEDTVPGEAIVIAEIAGLGRVLTLICADISADEPGGWVLENIGLDWLNAPIMDGSTCWTQAKRPWVIARAERIARSGAAAVVTNSMTMTQWNNEVIRRESKRNPSYPYKEYSDCGIALAVSSEGPSIRMQHITEPLERRGDPVVRVISWTDGWAGFPVGL